MRKRRGSEWKRRKLGEFFQIKHGYAFKGKHFSHSGTLVLLTPGNFRAEGGIRLKGEKEKYYSGDFPPEFLLKQGDLLIVMTDLTQNAPILGSPAFIPKSGRFLHNQRLGKIVDLRTSQIDERFLFYLLNSRDVRGQIRASATGATVRHTAPDRIYAVDAAVPDLPVQRRIAAILSAYNDLIENSRRRIEILEEMARRIYREWFVEFRFACEKCSIEGGISLNYMRLPSLSLDGTYVGSEQDGAGLSAQGIRTDGDLILRNFTAHGGTQIYGATIGGNVVCTGGNFVNENGHALSLFQTQVAGSVYLDHGFQSTGKVSLRGASIGGNLVCSGTLESTQFVHSGTEEIDRVCGGRLHHPLPVGKAS
jgi:hypothetical protein